MVIETSLINSHDTDPALAALFSLPHLRTYDLHVKAYRNHLRQHEELARYRAASDGLWEDVEEINAVYREKLAAKAARAAGREAIIALSRGSKS